MIMFDENGITPIYIKHFNQMKMLANRIKTADTALPSPLTQSQIHQIQTNIEAIYRINMEKGYVFFGKHILSTTYPPLPIDKDFNPKVKISQTLSKTIKDSLKRNIIAYILVIVTIEDIYNALAILAHIDDTAMSDAELMQFLSTLYQPSIIKTKSWNL